MNYRKYPHSLALILTAALCLAALSGCSSNGKNAAGASSSSASSAVNSSSGNEVPSSPVSASSGGVSQDDKEGLSPEEQLAAGYNQDIDDQQKVNELLSCIADVDFGKLKQVEGMDGQKAEELLGYLYNHRQIISTGQYEALFRATNGLDGALAESYAALAADLYKQHPDEVIQTLTGMTGQAQKLEVIHHIAYGLSYQETAPYKEDVQDRLDQQGISESETDVLKALLEALNNPY